MGKLKATFTLDAETLRKLTQTAERLSMPKSQIVGAAIEDYHARAGRMSESERKRKKKALKEFLATPSKRSQQEVDRELEELRSARRSGGRNTQSR